MNYPREPLPFAVVKLLGLKKEVQKFPNMPHYNQIIKWIENQTKDDLVAYVERNASSFTDRIGG